MKEPILQPRSNFLNPYEKAYTVLKTTNPNFDETIWRKVINGSSTDTDVNGYIAALEKIKNLSANELNAKYNLDYADWNTKLLAQLNEAYRDDLEKEIKERERYKINDDGTPVMKDGLPDTEKYTVSDYEYFGDLIRARGKANYEDYLLQQEKERKESMNGFTKFVASTAATLGHALSGFTKEVDGVANFFEGIAAGVDSAIKGNSFQKGMADYIATEDSSKEWGTQLENLLVDFEKRFTNMRDLDGNLTSGGKFFVSLADSFGQMAPAMIITAATSGVGGAVGGIAEQLISKGIPVISQTIFYSGITANQTREMYEYYASKGVTVPTEEILTNAEMKAVGQALVENALGKMMGGSILDNLTYGRSVGKSIGGKSFVGRGLARVAHDFLEEGSEEVLQEFSDYFVDKIWQRQYDNWGQFADITPENLGLSFVIGGISSFIGSAVRILRTPNMKIATSVDNEGNVQYKTLGKGVVGKIASYEYGVTLQEAISNVNKIIEHRKTVVDALSKTNRLSKKFGALQLAQVNQEFAHSTAPKLDSNVFERKWTEHDLHVADVALAQAYASYRMLASIYQEVGPERFNAANDLLIFGSKNNDRAFYDLRADILMRKLTDLGSAIPQKITTKRGKDKIVGVYTGEFRDLIIQRRFGNIKAIFNKEDDELSPAVKELFDKYGKSNTVIVTDSGAGALETDDGTIIVPSAELNNAGASVVIADLSEQKLTNWVSSQLSTSEHLLGLRQIKDWYKELYGIEATDEDVANKLCFDDKFFKVVLFKANKDALTLLTTIIDQLSKIDVKNFADGVLKSKFEQTISMMKATLKESLVYNFRANLQQIPTNILNEKDKKDIIRDRWTQTLLYRVVNEFKNVTDDDRRKIILTINNMVTYSDKKRSELIKQVLSESQDIRVNAVNEIRDYFDVYREMYDGTKYMPENSIPNISFNYFLKSKGIFIDTLLSENNLTKSDVAYMQDYKLNILQYRQKQFSEFTNNQYYFEHSTIDPFNIKNRNNVTIYETRTNKVVGISNYIAKMENKLDAKKSSFTTVGELSKDIHNLVQSFITDDLTDLQKSNVTMRDLIFNNDLLSDDVVAAMTRKFGFNSSKELTPQLKYVYFRQYIPTVIDSVSINITPEGDVLFVNYRPFKKVIKTFNRKDLKSGTYLAAFFKQEYLIGKLVDTTIKIDNRRVKSMSYSSKDNVIYINSNYVKSLNDAELAYDLTHELQHGIADVNGLNSGFTTEISKTVENKAFLRSMLLDVEKHVPELFKDVKDSNEKVKIFDKFMYLCSGETLAYGQEFTDLVTFYPILIEKKNDRSIITMPWGSKYDFENKSTTNILQKKGMLVYDVLKLGTTEISKEEYFSEDVTNTFIINGKLYTTDFAGYESMTEKLRTYFKNMPDTATENSIVSIGVDNGIVRVIADASVLYSEDNSTSTLIYEIIQHAMKHDHIVIFQDKTYDYVSGTLRDNTDIGNIADNIAEMYEQDIEDEQLSLDDFMPDDEIMEDVAIRVPSVKMKPKRQYNKTEDTSDKNKGRYITDKQRKTFESFKNVQSRQLSPELQKFYIGAEKNKNITPQLRDNVMDGTLRWSSDKTDKMSISYYLRTATDINDDTFDLINNSFFHNKHIKSFKELNTLINMSEEIYAISKIFDDDNKLDLLDNLGINAINDYIRLLDDNAKNKRKYDENKQEYGKAMDKGLWLPGGNIGYLRLNFLKYYDGTIGSAYQFVKELKGMNESKWNSWKKGYQDEDTLSNKAKEQNLSGADIFGATLREYFETRKNVAQDLEGIITELQKPWTNKTRYTLKSIYKFYRKLAKVAPAGFNNEVLLETILDSIYEPKNLDTQKQKWLAAHPEVAKFTVDARRYLINGPLAKSNYVAVSRDLVWFIIQKYGKNAFTDKDTFLKLQRSIQELVSDDVATRFFDGADDWTVVSDVEYEWVEAFQSMNDDVLKFMKTIYQHYELPIDTFENEEKEQFNKILSGKELREPANIVRSIKYYFNKLGPEISPKTAALLVENNPKLFTYDSTNNTLSLNDDAYLVKTKTYKVVKDKETGEERKVESVLTAYKFVNDLKDIREQIRDVVNAYLLGAYDNERALKSYKEAFAAYEKKVQKIYNNITDTLNKKKSTQKIVTYNINEREYSIEGDGDMPTIIVDLMKNQNMDADIRHSRVQFISDDDDAHIVAAFSNFNKANKDYLETLTQYEVEEIVQFYLTHAILSDKWSTDFETVRTGLLGYILYFCNAFDNNPNPKYVLSNDIIDKVLTMMNYQATKGGQYLRMQRSLLAMINPIKDFTEEIASQYGFKIPPEQVEELSDAINANDINKVGEIKSRIVLDFFAQSRVNKNYKKFVKTLAKFVDDGDFNNYDKLLDELNQKIDDEKQYGNKTSMIRQLTNLRDAINAKETFGKDDLKLNTDMRKYLSQHKRLLSEAYFDKNDNIKNTFGTYQNYQSAFYTYQIENNAIVLNDFLSLRYKNVDNFLDKLWNFERAMMLTSPGTWVRNQVSDVILHTTNRVSDSLIRLGDKMFGNSKKWHREGQYKIAGTKVITTDVKDFVDKLTDKNQKDNIFSQIDDAMNKYDARKIMKNSPDMNLAEMIVAKLSTDVSRGDIPFDKLGVKDTRGRIEKAVAKSKKFLFKMLSDSMWVKIEFKRVLARMLVEENIDIAAEGLSNKVQQMIAEAYTFAAQTYMHKSNFMNKIDDVIRKKAGSFGYFMWKQIFPFASASWNWFIAGISYTPIGLAKGIVNLIKLDNTIEKLDLARQKGETVVSSKFAEYLAKRDIGHGVIGTFGFIIGCLLAGFGKAALDDDDGKYKLRVGDVMIDISDVFSSNGLLVGMALVQACQENSGDNWFDNFMYVMNTVMNQMILESSFSDLFNTIRYNENLGDFMMTMGIYTIPSMFIPNAIKSLNGLFGKYKVKYVSGIAGKFERLGFQIAPYLTLLNSVPKYIDPYTGEKQVAMNLGWFSEDWLIPSIINKYGPIDFKPYNVSDYEKAAVELGVKKSMLTGDYTIDGKDINVSGKTLENLNKYYGQLNASMLSRLMNDDIRMKVQMDNGSYKDLRYSQMTDKQKKNAIENIMEKNAKFAEVYTMTGTYGYKYYASESEFVALKKLGITENVYRANAKYKGFIKK